jgi:hypothetical protein
VAQHRSAEARGTAVILTAILMATCTEMPAWYRRTVVDVRRRWEFGAVALASVMLACGPNVPLDADATTTSTDGGMGETSTPPATTEPTPADESTSNGSTSTSGFQSSSDEEESGGDPTGNFVGPGCGQDAGLRFTHCGDIQCDLWAQDCMRGQKCAPAEDRQPNAWGRSNCVDLVRDPGAPGDPCFVEGDAWTGLDDCQIGVMCWDTDPETNAGTCVAFCGGSQANPTCNEGLTCFSAYDDHINLCLPPCDPLSSACGPGLACVKSNWYPAFACIPESLVADRVAYADACDDIVGCGSGLVCVDAEDVPGCDTEKCCSLLCDPLADNGCPELARGQLCVPFGAQPEIGHCGFA